MVQIFSFRDLRERAFWFQISGFRGFGVRDSGVGLAPRDADPVGPFELHRRWSRLPGPPLTSHLLSTNLSVLVTLLVQNLSGFVNCNSPHLETLDLQLSARRCRGSDF